MYIFGIHLENLPREELLTRCQKWLTGDDFHRIATVNPEFLLQAKQDTLFAQNLQAADARVIDGFGIVLVGWLRGESLCRFPGADLLTWLLAYAEKNEFVIGLVIRQDGLSSYEEIRRALLIQYPRLKITGGEMNDPYSLSRGREGSSLWNLHSAKMVFCNFGAPEQEYFVEQLRNEPGSISLVMGVGGSFDYLTGKVRRAPTGMRALGLEWLWRLIQQPKRLRRIWRATVVFLYQSLINPHEK